MSSTNSLPERAAAVGRQLRSLRRRFRAGSWITLIVGGLLLLLVAGYFTYGYRELASLRDPELIVSLVGDAVDQQIPLLRSRLENEVKTNAPVWAEQASQQAIAAIPPLRQNLEQLALQKSDELIAKIDMVGEQQFRRIIDANRATMRQAIQQLKDDDKVGDDVLLALQQALEKELQIDAKSQAGALLIMVSDLNQNMKRLRANEGLTHEQQMERRVLMLARRLQMKHLGDVKLEELSLPAVHEIVGDMERKKLKQEMEQKAAKSGETPAAATGEPTPRPRRRPRRSQPTERRRPPSRPKLSNQPKPNRPKPNRPKPSLPKPSLPKPNLPKPNLPKPNRLRRPSPLRSPVRLRKRKRPANR